MKTWLLILFVFSKNAGMNTITVPDIVSKEDCLAAGKAAHDIASPHVWVVSYRCVQVERKASNP